MPPWGDEQSPLSGTQTPTYIGPKSRVPAVAAPRRLRPGPIGRSCFLSANNCEARQLARSTLPPGSTKPPLAQPHWHVCQDVRHQRDRRDGCLHVLRIDFVQRVGVGVVVVEIG